MTWSVGPDGPLLTSPWRRVALLPAHWSAGWLLSGRMATPSPCSRCGARGTLTRSRDSGARGARPPQHLVGNGTERRILSPNFLCGLCRAGCR